MKDQQNDQSLFTHAEFAAVPREILLDPSLSLEVKGQ